MTIVDTHIKPALFSIVAELNQEKDIFERLKKQAVLRAFQVDGNVYTVKVEKQDMTEAQQALITKFEKQDASARHLAERIDKIDLLTGKGKLGSYAYLRFDDVRELSSEDLDAVFKHFKTKVEK